jgi:hypothetical protein
VYVINKNLISPVLSKEKNRKERKRKERKEKKGMEEEWKKVWRG